MKSFKRTPSGLNNQHLFYGVDIIVYLEGGNNSFNKQEVCDGRFNEETNDILFWTNVFEKVSGKTSIKFKSVGSKTTVTEIANDIVAGIVNNTFVAMDKEFDDVFDKQINHPKVLYTYGYSWENDVWECEVIKAVIEELSVKKITNTDIEDNLTRFLTDIRIGVIADAYLFKKASSFFPRPKGHLALVNCFPTDLPHVIKASMKSLMIKKAVKPNTLNSFARRTQFDIRYSCYGHLFADYCYQLVLHYIKNRLRLPGLNPAYIHRMGINKFFSQSFATTVSNKYYDLVIKQAIAA